jgi:hypothetical protein
MRHIKEYNSASKGISNLSEGMVYHVERNIPLMESVYRIESESWISLVNEARELWERNVVDLNEDDLFLISTDAGKYGIYEKNLVLLDVPFWEGEFDYDWEEYDALEEAEYRGRNVKLNKPFRTPGGPRKFSVYTKNDSGNIVKVSFGQPGMRVNNADPKKARSFRKRMRCDQPGPRWKAKWWSCNVARYRKLLGIKSSNPW